MPRFEGEDPPADPQQLAELARLTDMLAQVEGLHSTAVAVSSRASLVLERLRRLPTAPPRPKLRPATPTAQVSPFLDIREAAEYCRMSKGTLYNALYQGKLSKQPGTRKVLFTRLVLDTFLSTKPKRRR